LVSYFARAWVFLQAFASAPHLAPLRSSRPGRSTSSSGRRAP